MTRQHKRSFRNLANWLCCHLAATIVSYFVWWGINYTLLSFIEYSFFFNTTTATEYAMALSVFVSFYTACQVYKEVAFKVRTAWL